MSTIIGSGELLAQPCKVKNPPRARVSTTQQPMRACVTGPSMRARVTADVADNELELWARSQGFIP